MINLDEYFKDAAELIFNYIFTVGSKEVGLKAFDDFIFAQDNNFRNNNYNTILKCYLCITNFNEYMYQRCNELSLSEKHDMNKLNNDFYETCGIKIETNGFNIEFWEAASPFINYKIYNYCKNHTNSLLGDIICVDYYSPYEGEYEAMHILNFILKTKVAPINIVIGHWIDSDSFSKTVVEFYVNELKYLDDIVIICKAIVKKKQIRLFLNKIHYLKQKLKKMNSNNIKLLLNILKDSLEINNEQNEESSRVYRKKLLSNHLIENDDNIDSKLNNVKMECVKNECIKSIEVTEFQFLNTHDSDGLHLSNINEEELKFPNDKFSLDSKIIFYFLIKNGFYYSLQNSIDLENIVLFLFSENIFDEFMIKKVIFNTKIITTRLFSKCTKIDYMYIKCLDLALNNPNITVNLDLKKLQKSSILQLSSINSFIKLVQLFIDNEINIPYSTLLNIKNEEEIFKRLEYLIEISRVEDIPKKYIKKIISYKFVNESINLLFKAKCIKLFKYGIQKLLKQFDKKGNYKSNDCKNCSSLSKNSSFNYSNNQDTSMLNELKLIDGEEELIKEENSQNRITEKCFASFDKANIQSISKSIYKNDYLLQNREENDKILLEQINEKLLNTPNSKFYYNVIKCLIMNGYKIPTTLIKQDFYGKIIIAKLVNKVIAKEDQLKNISVIRGLYFSKGFLHLLTKHTKFTFQCEVCIPNQLNCEIININNMFRIFKYKSGVRIYSFIVDSFYKIKYKVIANMDFEVFKIKIILNERTLKIIINNFTLVEHIPSTIVFVEIGREFVGVLRYLLYAETVVDFPDNVGNSLVTYNEFIKPLSNILEIKKKQGFILKTLCPFYLSSCKPNLLIQDVIEY